MIPLLRTDTQVKHKIGRPDKATDHLHRYRTMESHFLQPKLNIGCDKDLIQLNNKSILMFTMSLFSSWFITDKHNECIDQRIVTTNKRENIDKKIRMFDSSSFAFRPTKVVDDRVWTNFERGSQTRPGSYDFYIQWRQLLQSISMHLNWFRLKWVLKEPKDEWKWSLYLSRLGFKSGITIPMLFHGFMDDEEVKGMNEWMKGREGEADEKGSIQESRLFCRRKEWMRFRVSLVLEDLISTHDKEKDMSDDDKDPPVNLVVSSPVFHGSYSSCHPQTKNMSNSSHTKDLRSNQSASSRSPPTSLQEIKDVVKEEALRQE